MPKAPSASRPRHILLAADLTAAGDRAFDRAVLLAKEWGASLALCHVVESNSLHPIGIERRIRNVEAEMAELEQRARAALKQVVSRHILVGDPGDRIVAHARAIRSDIVVTGPAYSRAGRKRRKHRCAHRAQCPCASARGTPPRRRPVQEGGPQRRFLARFARSGRCRAHALSIG